MTDDIVTRLRIACREENPEYCGECQPCQAADEIERLRAALEELQRHENAHKALLDAYRWSHAHFGEWPDAIVGLVAENYTLKKELRGD